MQRAGRRGAGGFTLIEIMAVVLIIALALGLVLPNIAATRASALEQRAREVASRIELARERAIVTGIPHRVSFELEEGAFRVEWWVTEAKATGEPEQEQPAALAGAGDVPPAPDYGGNAPLSLEPPVGEQPEYFPIPSRFGQDAWLPEDYFFEGIEGPDGWRDRGEYFIVFQADGTTDYAEIVVGDAWEHRVLLEIQPLLDMVRIRHEESD